MPPSDQTHRAALPLSGKADATKPEPTQRATGPTQDLLLRIWRQNQPLMRERLTQLERLAANALAGEVDTVERSAAADIAHKLAGSLGMFGFPEGTTLARTMEVHLEAPAAVDGALLSKLCAQLRAVLSLEAAPVSAMPSTA